MIRDDNNNQKRVLLKGFPNYVIWLFEKTNTKWVKLQIKINRTADIATDNEFTDKSGPKLASNSGLF